MGAAGRRSGQLDHMSGYGVSGECCCCPGPVVELVGRGETPVVTWSKEMFMGSEGRGIWNMEEGSPLDEEGGAAYGEGYGIMFEPFKESNGSWRVMRAMGLSWERMC